MLALVGVVAIDSYLIWSQKDGLDFRVGEKSAKNGG